MQNYIKINETYWQVDKETAVFMASLPEFLSHDEAKRLLYVYIELGDGRYAVLTPEPA